MDALDRAASDLPNRDLLRVKEQEIRWANKDFKKHSDAFMYGLASLGCRPGDTVATALGNDTEHAVLIYAAARLGVVVAPFDEQVLSDRSSVESALSESNARVFMFGKSAAVQGDADVASMVNEILPCRAENQTQDYPEVDDARFPHLRHVVSTDYYRVNKGIQQFRHLLAYNVYARDPAKRAKQFVHDDTPLIRPVSSIGQDNALTHGDLSRRAAAVKSSLQLTNADKLYLSSRDPVDLAIGIATACETSCPIVIPGVFDRDRGTAPTDESKIYESEGCTKKIDTFAVYA